MTKDQWRGVYVIVTTPFNDDLSLDEQGLRNTVEFCIDCGVQGVVSTANASEVAFLTDEERARVAHVVAETARNKVLTIVGVSSTCAQTASGHAQHAQAVGADCIMAMPPTFQRPSENEVRKFYAHLSKVCDLPIMLQNFGGPGGTAMSPELMCDLVREIPQVQYVKEETEFSSILMSDVIEMAPEGLHGVMGGKAGIKLLDEYRRGACGTMPACEISDVHVSIWNALEAGEHTKAAELYRLMLPLANFEVGYGPAVYKEVLRRRGVIKSSAFRQTGGKLLDKMAHAELDQIMEGLAPLMTTAPLTALHSTAA